MSENKNTATKGKTSGKLDMSAFGMNVSENFKEVEGFTSPLFEPRPEGKKKYVFIFKLLVNLRDPDNSIISKTEYMLEDIEGSFSYDSLVTFKKSRECPLSKAYWSMNEGKGLDRTVMPEWEKEADKLKQRHSHGVFIQIVKDFTNPENDGKIFPYRMPVAVYKYVKECVAPDPDEVEQGSAEQFDLFNMFNSYNIKVQVTKESKGRKSVPSLTKDMTAIKIDGKEMKEGVQEDMQAVWDLLTNYEHDLAELFEYKEPTEEENIRVKSFLVTECRQDPNKTMPNVEYVKTEPMGEDIPDADVDDMDLPDGDDDIEMATPQTVTLDESDSTDDLIDELDEE